MSILWPALRVLLLLAVANGAPIIVKRLVGRRWDWPLDGGLRFVDGRALLGASKTVRGVVAAVVSTAVGGAVLGLPWGLGAWIGALSMVGDVLSSFIKRRVGVPPSGRAMGLDQIPEALLPAWVLHGPLGLTLGDVVAVTLAFFLLEMPLAWLFFKLRLRDRPY
jgi:CDP-2,3-bis-(O-geranylgeranyl)-sn-glycerol synthase